MVKLLLSLDNSRVLARVEEIPCLATQACIRLPASLHLLKR
jgi:hypothetical protein